MPPQKNYLLNQPLVPPKADFFALIEQIFDARWLTNFGAVHEDFRARLQETLGCEHVLPVTNATIGLFTVMRALEITGEVITVPFTFPATYNVLFNLPNVMPVFVDVSRESCCISPDAVRKAITPKTTAILAVHAYGFPCDVDQLSQIARERNLKLVYDAAPAIGVKLGNASLVSFGDASVLSFHATKLFNTAEGGAIVCRTRELYDKCRLFINFGIQNEDTIQLAGLNGKMDELRCALGLLNLRNLDLAIESRRRVVEHYIRFFESLGCPDISIPSIHAQGGTTLNYAYFPIVITPREGFDRNILYTKCRERGVCARKYYYPTILDLSVYSRYQMRIEAVPNSAFLSRNVLCLPVNPYLTEADCSFITESVAGILADAGRQ